VYALLDQPGDEAAQLRFIDLAPFVQRNQKRGEDSFQFAQFDFLSQLILGVLPSYSNDSGERISSIDSESGGPADLSESGAMALADGP